MSNTSNSTQVPSSTVVPDEETRIRIENLAIVGDALMSTGYSETSFGTDYFLAKESLLKFEEGINKLSLSPKARNGINSLIKYLKEKVDKRMRQANTDESLG